MILKRMMIKYLILILLLVNCEATNINKNCLNIKTSFYSGCYFLCKLCSQYFNSQNFYFTNGICYHIGPPNICAGTPIQNTIYTCCLDPTDLGAPQVR